MDRVIDRTLSAALAVSAIVLVIVFVRRESTPAAASRERPAPIYIDDWTELLTAGYRVSGADDATVVVLEFADFECPYCRRFASDMQRITSQYGDSLLFMYLHFPLTSHRFAIPAARAADCAAQQGNFVEYHDLLFEKQDSLGLKSWPSFAKAAGVRDSIAFAICIESTDAVPLIDKGREAGRRLGVRGTPTVVINGWLYSGGMGAQLLEAAVAAAFEGKSPVRNR
jgi:protein-disulfide isomerase